MRNFDFSLGLTDEFFYCYSPQAKSRGVFYREDGCIKNAYNHDVNDYEYTTAMLKERLSVGNRIVVECDFEKRGAPLIVITDKIYTKDGVAYYGEHFEVVAFEEGCNVWHNTPSGEEDPKRALITEKVHFESIPTPNKSRVVLSVEFLDEEIKVEMNSAAFSVSLPGMPGEFYFGITACEGINRFYGLRVE
jgi:hypothetical protein